jgi:predicted CoA-binding protein
VAIRSNVAIPDFLSQKRIAVVGVSKRPGDFSRYVFRELAARAYDVVPVNRLGGMLEGRPCFARVQDIQPPVDGALLLTPPEATAEVVKDCFAAGVTRVWMHRGVGPGAVNAAAAAFCRQHGISVVEGACPMMFLKRAGFGHRLHGALLKLARRHPGQCPA